MVPERQQSWWPRKRPRIEGRPFPSRFCSRGFDCKLRAAAKEWCVSQAVLAVVSVLGKDQKGVVAQFATYMAERGINIEDIAQRVIRGFFLMDMLVDLRDLNCDLSELITGLLGSGVESTWKSASICTANDAKKVSRCSSARSRIACSG